MITLYHGGPSGHSASLLIALAEKRLAYAEARLDLAAFDQHRSDFLTINPSGQVPVLVEDDWSLTETFFVLLYLEECYPEPALGGRTPRERYAVQKWGKYVETHIAPNLSILGWSVRGAGVGEAAAEGFAALPPERRALWNRARDGFAEDEVESARIALLKAVDRVAEDLAATAWLAGESYGIADIAVYPHLARLPACGIALPAVVEQWIARIDARPALRDALGETGIDHEIVTMGPERGRWG